MLNRSSSPESRAGSFRCVPDLWHHRVESTPDAEAMYFRSTEGWQTLTWQECANHVRRIANAVLSLGVEREQRCAILSGTRVEWILADLGILCAGAATTTLFPSSTDDECKFILNHCEAVIVFCDTETQVERLVAMRDELPSVRHVVVFDGAASGDDWVWTRDQLEQRGVAHADAHPQAYEQAVDGIQPGDLAALMYTSGTTGVPKGVMLTHDAWVYESEALDRLGFVSPADKQFLCLPLSHVFAKVMEILFIRLGVPTVVDGDTKRIVKHMEETRPTWMGAVPRLFERAYDAILAEVREAGPARASLFNWALAVGYEVSSLRQQGKRPRGLLWVRYKAANRLVFRRLRERFGGRIRFFISGGAPLSVEIAEFFHAIGLPVLEGYGLTESSAASCLNCPEDFVIGTVGRPVPGCEIRLAQDGEILLRSRGVMAGYYRDPEATQEALTEDGWLLTGDIGLLLDSGHLKITDRKKEVIVTAAGKNIAPAHFQNLLQARSPYVSHVVMHGDKRPFCVALVAIDEATVSRWAREHNLSFTDYADLSSRPQVQELISQAIAVVNKDLPSFEAVRKFALLPEDLSVEDGTLTPSLKIKRRVVEARYLDVLDALYGSSTG